MTTQRLLALALLAALALFAVSVSCVGPADAAGARAPDGAAAQAARDPLQRAKQATADAARAARESAERNRWPRVE